MFCNVLHFLPQYLSQLCW